MKCPKCKKEMIEIVNGFGDFNGELCCGNENCWFFGIIRITFDEE